MGHPLESVRCISVSKTYFYCEDFMDQPLHIRTHLLEYPTACLDGILLSSFYPTQSLAWPSR